MDLLDPENECGRSLLLLVSEGNVRLAHLQALALQLPKPLLAQGTSKYQQVLFDFGYLTEIDLVEDKIKGSAQLSQLDEQFCQEYLSTLERYYELFEMVVQYLDDLHAFIKEVNEEVFKNYSLEGIFEKTEGQQLMCQSLHLYASMLLLMDMLIPGPVRERIIISIYRYKGGEARVSNMGPVMRLFRSTEFQADKKLPAQYPQNYFSRLKVDDELVRRIITVILQKDIYENSSVYPNHPTVALANQAAILFTVLFFRADVLHSEDTLMRQIVDKHFPDCWVIPFYLGYVVDLTQFWKNFKAARKALGNILDLQKIQQKAIQSKKQLSNSAVKCDELLSEEGIDQEFILQKLNDIMGCLRKGNINLRWQMLHRKTSHQQVKLILLKHTNEDELVRVVLKFSQFEDRLKKGLEMLLKAKESLWNGDREICSDCLNQLSEYFGAKAGKVQGAQAIRDWFSEMQKLVNNLNSFNDTFVARKLKDCIKALQDVQNKIPINIHVKEYLERCRGTLQHMRKIKAVGDDLMEKVQTVSDMSWAWQTLSDYIEALKKQIKNQPKNSLLLKNLFAKMSSILSAPVARVLEANSPNLEPVSKFYSTLLVKLVKQVMQGIPKSMFQSIQRLSLIMNDIRQIPQKFEKEKYRQFTQLQLRQQVTKLLGKITILAQSVFTMESYLVGVAEVRPREILQEGLRKQLCSLLAQLFDSFKFNEQSPQQFQAKITILGLQMQHLKSQLVRVQDFIRTSGLQLFNSEIFKLIDFYTRIDFSCLLLSKISFQEDERYPELPLPIYGPNDQVASFLGRIVLALKGVTDSKKCFFNKSTLTFFTSNNRQIFSFKMLALLEKAVTVKGLASLGQLLGAMISKEIKNFGSELNAFNLDLNSKERVLQIFQQLKTAAPNKNIAQLISSCVRIGQLALIRSMISAFLEMRARKESGIYFSAFSRLSSTVLEICNGSQFSKSQQPLLKAVSQGCSTVGAFDALRTAYCDVLASKDLDKPLFSLIVIMSQRFQYDPKLACLKRKVKSQIDPVYFINGITVLLFQRQLKDLGNLFFRMKQAIEEWLLNKVLQEEAFVLREVGASLGQSCECAFEEWQQLGLR